MFLIHHSSCSLGLIRWFNYSWTMFFSRFSILIAFNLDQGTHFTAEVQQKSESSLASRLPSHNIRPGRSDQLNWHAQKVCGFQPKQLGYSITLVLVAKQTMPQIHRSVIFWINGKTRVDTFSSSSSASPAWWHKPPQSIYNPIQHLKTLAQKILQKGRKTYYNQTPSQAELQQQETQNIPTAFK